MSDPVTPLSKKWLYGPFIVAGIILLAYCLLWRAGAAQMKSAVYDWIDDQRAAGMTIVHGDITSDGFPFFLRAHIDEIDMTSPEGWQWLGERLSIDALPYDLNRLIFSPRGKQILRIESLGEWHITAEDLRASIANDKARGWAFAITVGDGTATRRADGTTAKLKSLALNLAPEADAPTTIGLNLAVTELKVTQAEESITLTQLQSIIFISNTHLLAGHQATQQWRDNEGEISIPGLYADIESTKLRLKGSIHLDNNNYPAGLVTTELQSPAGLTRLLGKAGALSTDEAEAAAAGLSLMAIASGGKITAPIDLREGKASIGGIKIADLPRVR